MPRNSLESLTVCQHNVWNFTLPRCDGPATSITIHPILGRVPTCDTHRGFGKLPVEGEAS